MLSRLGFITFMMLYSCSILLCCRATSIPALRRLITAFGKDAVRLFKTLDENMRICEYCLFCKISSTSNYYIIMCSYLWLQAATGLRSSGLVRRRCGVPSKGAGADDGGGFLRPFGWRGGRDARFQDADEILGAAAVCQRLDEAVSNVNNVISMS